MQKFESVIEKLTGLFCMFGFQTRLTRGLILFLTNLNRDCIAWVFLQAGLPGITLEAMDKSNVITVSFGKQSFWLYV